MLIHFTVNRKEMTMDAAPEKRLLDFIREDLHLTGTKEGCGIGECGACTVILTVEGLEKDGELDILQKMFIKDSAVQCGFCTAGMLMSGKALLMRNPHPTDEEIRRAIAGNICRCSGYKEIRQAIKDAADAGKEEEA